MNMMKFSCCYLIIVLSILNGSRGIYRSQIKLSSNGFQFQPVNYQGQILSTFVKQNDLPKSCSIQCTQNILCRIFDIHAVVPSQCRLFQGDMNIHGNIIPSNMSNARVGTLQFSTDFYLNYGQSCSSSSDVNRYLSCGRNFTWECPTNTYWNPSTSMCAAQSPVIGSSCQQNMSMCREDLNYTCLRFNQCGPLSLLMGTTLLDSNTIIANSPTIGLNYPATILVNKTADNSIIVVNTFRSQVIRFYDDVSSVNNVSLIAQNWSGGNSFTAPLGGSIHSNQKSNLYVSDMVAHCVIKLFNMQVISPLPTVVAGIKGSSGSGTNKLNTPIGIAVDSNENLYIADYANHRIMFWPPNSTTGTVIAGSGTAGSDSFSLNLPIRVYLDENNSTIYVSDSGNHRIQKFSLVDGFPRNATTIAGGYGPGNSNKHLNEPTIVYITKKTRAMYVADSLNNRIQRYKQGEEPVTIAGDPNGNVGNNATMLNNPRGIAVDDEETYLYVADTGNNRIQRFKII